MESKIQRKIKQENVKKYSDKNFLLSQKNRKNNDEMENKINGKINKKCNHKIIDKNYVNINSNKNKNNSHTTTNNNKNK